MTLNEAKHKAISAMKESGYDLLKVSATEDLWLFAFGKKDNPPIPGVPILAVKKGNGEIEWISVPPISNLEILHSAETIEDY